MNANEGALLWGEWRVFSFFAVSASKLAMSYIFEPPAIVSVPVQSGGEFPVRRIFCVGKNYADHVAEMGGDPKADPPVFFTKPADAIVENGAVIPYAKSTENLHYEGELVIALGAGGSSLTSRAEAGALIFGAACGCDLTRRDHQKLAKGAGTPWDVAKGFDQSAPIAPIASIEDVPPSALDDVRLKTIINGETKQDEGLTSMIWTTPEIIIALSNLFTLKAGDLIFTGTPAGVGAVTPGDKVRVEIGPLPALEFSITDPQ